MGGNLNGQLGQPCSKNIRFGAGGNRATQRHARRARWEITTVTRLSLKVSESETALSMYFVCTEDLLAELWGEAKEKATSWSVSLVFACRIGLCAQKKNGRQTRTRPGKEFIFPVTGRRV